MQLVYYMDFIQFYHVLIYIKRSQWQPTKVLLSGKSHGWRSVVGCSPCGHNELDTTERLHFHALEKEMATHSSVLAWRIPGTGEPGGLPSMGSHSQTQLKRLSSSSSVYISYLFFFSFIFISWWLITLQYCSGFCHTLTCYLFCF